MAGILLGEKSFTVDNNDSNWLQMDNIFSRRFSAYELHFNDFYTQQNTNINDIYMNLIDNTGAVKSDSTYYSARAYGRGNADGRQASQSYSGVAYWRVAMGSYNDYFASTHMVIHTPFESNRITSFYSTDLGTTSEHYHNMRAGTYETNACITGFRLYSNDNNEELYMGNVTVFGLGK